ncbi:MAG: aspartate/glutamate racemase family protein [Solirubrobacteraceae bacterium]
MEREIVTPETTRLALLTGVGRDGSGRVDDGAELWQAVQDYVDHLLPPGFSMDLRFLDGPLGDLGNARDRGSHAMALVEDALECERLGYAGVLMGPALDPGVTEARSALEIPVVGPIEAAMALSTFYGRRVGIVTVRRRYIAKLRENITSYGMRDRLIEPHGVTHFELDYDDYVAALRGDAGPLGETYAQAAAEPVAAGADVLLGAHQLLGVAFWRAGYQHADEIGVPYVDCLAAGIAGLVAAVGLQRTVSLRTSRHINSIFRTASAHDADVQSTRTEA